MQAPSKTVFVTGATGFIGQRLVSALLQQGYTVRVLIRPEKSRDSRIPPGCEQYPLGLTDVDKLRDIVADCTAVIYCAGSVRGRKFSDFANANMVGVGAILDALEQSGVSTRLLLLSSLAASRPHVSAYARSKYEGEQLLAFKPLLPWTIFRPPAVYGPGDREMLPIFKMIRRGLLAHAGPSDQRLSLLHVDDLANAVVAWLAVSKGCTHKTYAIDDGTPGGYSWEAIGDAVNAGKFLTLKLPRFVLEGAARINLLLASMLNYQPMLTPGKVQELVQAHWLCNNTEFTKATGWKPRLDLKLGIQQLFNESPG